MGNVAAVLEYGSLGLLAIVIAGFFWYVRSVEARAARREQLEQERQDKYIDALVKSTSTLAVLLSRVQAQDKQMQDHDQRMTDGHRRLQEEHEALMNAYSFAKRGIGE